MFSSRYQFFEYFEVLISFTFIMPRTIVIRVNITNCATIEEIKNHQKLESGTKVSNIVIGQAKLFHCASALLTRGRRPNSAEGNPYSTNSLKHERANTTHAYICSIKCSRKTSQNRVLKEKMSKCHLRSLQMGNTSL